MLNLGRRVEGSRIEDAAYHGSGRVSLVHVPGRLRAFAAAGSVTGGGGASGGGPGRDAAPPAAAAAALSAAMAAGVAAPLSFAPPLVAVVVPRSAAAAEEEERKGARGGLPLPSSLVAHAARSLSAAAAASSFNPGALPVFVALDAGGFKAASRAAPYSVLLASDFLPASWPLRSRSNGSSPFGDAAAVAAVAAALSRSGGGDGTDGGKRGVLVLSSPAVGATGGALDETLLRLQGGAGDGREGGGGRRGGEAPTLLLVPSPSPRSRSRSRRLRKGGGGGGSRGGAAAFSSSSSSAAAAVALFPEMLWAPPSGRGQVPNALLAWSRALAEEAEREEEREAAREEGGAAAAAEAPPPLSLLATAASSARVAVARLPACVFARSQAWDRAKKRRGGFGALSVRLVSFDHECRRRRSESMKDRDKNEIAEVSTSSAAACAREKLLEAGLWSGGEEMEEGEGDKDGDMISD